MSVVNTRSPRETEEAGEALARKVAKGGIVLLQGPLGAGKTLFVRGLVAGLGGDPNEVRSPTYLGTVPYATPQGEMLHIDLYQRGRGAQAHRLLEEALEEAPRLLAVEWGREAPASAWRVVISEGKGERDRRLEITPP